MMDDYVNICASLAVHLYQKTPVPNDRQEVDRRNQEVKALFAGWEACLSDVPYIDNNGLRTQRKLILTRMLEKIIRSDAVRYEQACEELRTLSSQPAELIGNLSKRAQVYYDALKDADAKLPELSKAACEGYGCIALIALHADLELKGYPLTALVIIANKRSNSGALLLLASDIMNRPPFTSDSGRNNFSETDRALSCCAKKEKIARYKGGFSSIVAVLAHFPALQALGFSPDDVLRIASHDSGAKTIEAVLAHHGALIAKGFTNEHIVKIAEHDGGASNIQNTLECCDALLAEGVSHDLIVLRVCARRSKQQTASEQQLGAEEEQSWTAADWASLYALVGAVPDTAPGADGGGAPAILTEHDGTLLDALVVADSDSVPFAEAGANADQVTQD
jgi:hypothetical protein